MPLRFGEPLSGLDEYSKYFNPTSQHKFIMEASPGYFFGGLRLASKIHEVLGPINIIFILRDPVRRLFSLYRHLRKGLRIPANMSFEEYVHRSKDALLDLHDSKIEDRGNVFGRGISGGFYVDYLEQWYSVFGSSIKVLFFEHLIKDPLEFMCSLCDFLELRLEIYSAKSFTVENRSMMYRNRALHKIARTVNVKLEPFLRRNYGLKNYLRKVYFLFNETTNDIEFITLTLQSYLESLYSAYNHRLLRLLIDKGYRNFPRWLNTTSSTDMFPRQTKMD